ncbi:adenosylcobinamide-GDP ribazoletransferase [Salsipaludibacter albus]|uniref:adenosylcobinamide-GDP ribazoletransferase n=1 Tax=Salsipaludibacter albus TaxID=2849650 RepID=UPI001EE3C6B8|nr:adenosylcobinamide-GDP ribazoletransferase [Salsipaludibacter albus]MBY5163913.1 adenosylcobinamide-GDP ribazoletransferase [Salsipaludibacter albus]
MTRLLVVAGRFLTRLPLPDIDLRDDDLARATGLFPVVGLVVALLAAAVALLARPLLGPLPAAVLAVATGVVVTGAFHEDGLADVADGWFGGWDAAGRLEIMRDSRVGTFGASALVLVLGLRVALLAGLPATGPTLVGRPDLPTAVPPVLAALATGHVVGRAGILVALWSAPVAPAGSLSTLVAGPGSAVTTGIGLATAVGVAWIATGAWAPVLLALVALVAIGTARWSVHKVGGLTGDALGATALLGHVTAMAVVVAVVT